MENLHHLAHLPLQVLSINTWLDKYPELDPAIVPSIPSLCPSLRILVLPPNLKWGIWRSTPATGEESTRILPLEDGDVMPLFNGEKPPEPRKPVEFDGSYEYESDEYLYEYQYEYQYGDEYEYDHTAEYETEYGNEYEY